MSTETPTVTYSSAIRATAERFGRAAPPEQVSDLNNVLQSIGRITDEGTVEVEIDGKRQPIDTFLAGAVTRFPIALDETGSQPSQSEFVKVTTGSMTSWRHKGDAMVRITKSFDDAHAAKLAQEVATWPNPWRAGPNHNRTRQTVIANTNATLAARLKAEAGV